MNTQWLQGTGVAVVTPFSNKGEVDISALRRIVDHLIQGGVDYLVALGTTGEPATLTKQEKQLVLETIIDQNAGRLPLILGAGGNNTREVLGNIVQESKRKDIAGFLSVSPYYNKPTQEGLFQHYKAIASCTDLPVILYNVPGRTATNMSAETTLQLAHSCQNIVAIKEASGDLTQCMNILRHCPRDFRLISGDDHLSLPLISIGASGVISVAANGFPAVFSNMIRLALAGDFSQARAIHYQLLELMRLNFAEGNPAGVKALLEHQGIAEKEVRLPLVNVSDELSQQLIRAWNEVFPSR